MKVITFQTTVTGEQIIRPPINVVLPEGNLEVTVKSVDRHSAITPSTRELANARLRRLRVSTGQATGIDNESIDADLARTYEIAGSPPPDGRRQ